MIPKIFHRIWLGKSKVPDQHEFWWTAWQRLYPDYEFITWDEDRFLSEQDRFPLLLEKANHAGSYAMKSDILRIAVLAAYGGVYIDTDFMPINRFDFHRRSDEILICRGNNAFIAAPKDSPILQDIARELERRSVAVSHPSQVLHLTGPIFIDEKLKAYEVDYVDSALFFPYHHDKTISTLFLQDLSQVYAAHIWNGSWYEAALESQKYIGAMVEGNLLELRDGLSLGRAHEISPVIDKYVKSTERMRAAIIDTVVDDGVIELNFSGSSSVVFSIFKLCFYLHQTAGSMSAWCIGSGNGVANSPLSASIAYYDIDALFVEPNPHLAKKIQGNFRRNSSVRIVNKACFNGARTFAMNLVRGDIARQYGLPEWVENLSHPIMSAMETQDVLNSYPGMTPEIANILTEHGFDLLQVETVSVRDLLAECQGRVPDIVSIEADYMEGAILADLISSGIRPKVISLTDSGICDGIDIFLKNHGYTVVVRDDRSVMAAASDFVIDYCKYLFVEFGIRSIFDLSLRSVFPDLNGKQSNLEP